MPRPRILYCGIFLLALGLRLGQAFSAPWYGDEGAVTEISRGFAGPGAPAAGAIKYNGLFPVSTSWIPFVSAAPFALLGLPALRLWAVLVELAALAALMALALRLGGMVAALGVGLAFAACVPAILFAGLGFYHHYSAMALAGSLACLARKEIQAGAFLAGLAAASNYWLYWWPLLLVLRLAFTHRGAAARAAGWAALPLAAAIAGNLALGGEGMLEDARWLLSLGSQMAPSGLREQALSVMGTLASYPVLLAGALGAAAALRDPASRGLAQWALLALLACLIEPLRQRVSLAVIAYPLIPAFVPACLGAGLLLAGLAKRQAWPVLGAALAAYALLQRPPMATLRSYSADPARAGELARFLVSQAAPGDLVSGQPSWAWRVTPGLGVVYADQAAAYGGRQAGLARAGMPASRYTRPVALSRIRFLVTNRYSVLFEFEQAGLALHYLRAEAQGWPKVWDNKSFRVHANPAFGYPKDPEARILDHPHFYELAKFQALEAGEPELARLAVARASSAPNRQ